MSKTLTTLLFFFVALPAIFFIFFAIKRKIIKWYQKGLNFAKGHYTNERVYDTTENRTYIQYDCSFSEWLHTRIFPCIYKTSIVIAIIFMLFVRIPSKSGYILRTSTPTKVEKIAVLDIARFQLVTGTCTAVTGNDTYIIDGNDICGLFLGEYIEKEINLYTAPGVVIRSIEASGKLIFNKLENFIAKQI